jgi:pimeloyl-ACP methyl ester carboxylesterase
MLLFAVASFPAVPGGDPPAHANWIGELQIGDRKALVELKLDTTGGPLTGTIAYPVRGKEPIALSTLSIDRDRVRFAWPDDGKESTFDGNIANGILAGNVQRGRDVGTLELAPVVPRDRDAEKKIVGYYELSPGHVLSITSFRFGPVYVHYTSGRVGVLFPSSQTEFFAGPAFRVPVPVRIRATLTMDSRQEVTGIRWQEGAAPERIGKKLTHRREEVVFKNGDVSLSGTLVLPEGSGPHPAIVRIHGSGPQTRRNSVDGWYAYHGIAYLSFDKRGAGKSTGDWRNAGLSELADDVLAAVRFLRGRQDIDRNQISVEGDSEGGWVVPVVAARDAKISSIVLGAGPVLDYVSELLNEVEENSKAHGRGGDDLKHALEFNRQALAMLKNGADQNDATWKRFQAFVHPYRNEKWFRYVALPERRSWDLKKLHLMSQLDTMSLWRRVTIPVLALYGGRDLNVPAEKNAIALESALKSAGNRDYTIKIFPNADHDGLDTDTRVPTADQLRYLQRYVPGYFSTQLDWVLAHTRRGTDSKNKAGIGRQGITRG